MACNRRRGRVMCEFYLILVMHYHFISLEHLGEENYLQCPA